MKKLLLIIFCFISIVGSSQYQTTNLDFLFNGSIAVNGSDTLLVDSLTGTFDSGYVLTDVDFDITLGYLPSKSKAKLNSQPLVTIFSNQNYADTLFTQWLGKSINADSTELLQSRIQRIAHYSTATSDVNDFFNVPEMATTGVITVGVGKDYISLDAANDAAAAITDTIYIYDGTYNEDIVTQAVNIAIGNVKVVAQSTACFISLNNASVNNVWCDGNLKSKSVYQTGQGDIAYNNCYMDNANDYNFQLIGSGVIQLNNCVLDANGTEVNNIWTNTGLDLNGCLLTGYTDGKVFDFSTSSNQKDILYTDINSQPNVGQRNIFDFGTGGTYNIKYCNMTTPILEIGMVNDNSALTGLLNFKGNTWNCDSLSSAYIKPSNTTQLFNINIEDNYFYTNDNATSGMVFIPSARDITISGNLFVSESPSGTNAIVVQDIQSGYDCYIGENEIRLFADGSPIALGSESTLQPNLNGTIIEKNKIQGSYFYDSTNSTSTHAIFVAGVIEDTVRYNDINGCNIGIVHKETGATLSGGVVYGNLLVDCSDNLLSKASRGIEYYNNTVVRTSKYDAIDIPFYGLFLMDNDGADPSDFTVFKNNIIADLGTTLTTGYLYYTEDNSIDDLDADYNVSYSLNNKVAFISGADKTWSEWQALTYDANSYNTDPNFKSNSELWVLSPSDAIGNGATLGVPYNFGLDKSSVWTDNIVLKEQPTNWYIGAYLDNDIGVVMFYNNNYISNINPYVY